MNNLYFLIFTVAIYKFSQKKKFAIVCIYIYTGYDNNNKKSLFLQFRIVKKSVPVCVYVCCMSLLSPLEFSLSLSPACLACTSPLNWRLTRLSIRPSNFQKIFQFVGVSGRVRPDTPRVLIRLDKTARTVRLYRLSLPTLSTRDTNVTRHRTNRALLICARAFFSLSLSFSLYIHQIGLAGAHGRRSTREREHAPSSRDCLDPFLLSAPRSTYPLLT